MSRLSQTLSESPFCGQSQGGLVPRGAERSSRPVIGIVIPGQHLLDKGGAAAVFKQQIDVVKGLGLRTLLIIVAPSLPLHTTKRTQRLKIIDRAAHNMGADRHVLVTAILPLYWAWRPVLSLWLARARRNWDLRSDLAASEILDVQELSQSCRASPDVVICNYLSGLSAADALVHRQRQILVLHDVPRRALSNKVVKVLNRIPHLVTLSADDADCLAERASSLASHVGVPFGRQLPLTFGDLGAYRNLGQLLDASRPNQAPTGGWSQSEWASANRLDLLFVGGKHPPNLAGLASFIGGCFDPFLYPQGVRLVVAGAAGPALLQTGLASPGVTVLGHVADLRPLYAAAKLVVVPLLNGTGLSLKTLEAISLGKPVLSSPVGLRGLSLRQTLALPPPFDEQWARQILHLLGSRCARRQLRDDLMTLHGQSSLESTLGGLMRPMLGEAPSGACMRATAGVVTVNISLTEWHPVSLDVLQRSQFDSASDLLIKQMANSLMARGFGSWPDCDDLASDMARDFQNAALSRTQD